MKNILLPLGEFIINIIISIVVVELTKKYFNFDVPQGILIGTIIFIALEMTQVSYILSRQNRYIVTIERTNSTLAEINDEIKNITNFEHNVSSYDNQLKYISEGLKKIATDYSHENDLFIPWYREMLDSLVKHITHTIENKSYFLDINIRDQDRMNDVFQGRKNDWFWATSSCIGIPWYTTTRGEIFIQEMHRKFVANKMAEIRRLFIYETESELSEFCTQLCFLLHDNSKYLYKIISRQDFGDIFKGFGDKNLVEDFGIYGNHFIWETSIENKIFIDSGYVCVDENKIKKYEQLFSKMWSHAIPYKIMDEQLKLTYKYSTINDFRTLYLSAITKG